MKKSLDITGIRYGKLVALSFSHKAKHRSQFWLFQCDCGQKFKANKYSVTRGDSKSCGCSTGEMISSRKRTHGLTRTRFNNIWLSIRTRCNNKHNLDYGGRGIKLLWLSFEEFKNDMYESYLEHVGKFGERVTQIDRIDNNGNYSKENCRWVTPVQNSSNRRSNILINFNGKKGTLKQITNIVGVDYKKTWSRIKIQGWDINKALSKI